MPISASFNLIAHRGASGYAPENTLAAFQKGLDMGANMLELDIHLSKDGEVVVIHDPTLERTTNGSGSVKDYTVKELQQFDAGKLFPEYRGERIPTLQQVCDLAKTRAGLAIEIKNGPVWYPEIEERLVRVIEQSDMVEEVIVIAFYHPSLKRIKELNPTIKTGILYSAGLIDPWSIAEAVGAEALHPDYKFLTKDVIAESRKRGYFVHPWTINTASDMQQFLRAGVTGITSNYPDILRDISQNFRG